MTQRQDDLTQVKYVGPTRMQLLNDHGIKTIRQLYQIPEEELAGIKSIGKNYARIIQSAAAAYDGKAGTRSTDTTPSPGKRETDGINHHLEKKIGKLKRMLDRTNENLKPLGKKKYLVLYVEMKKRSSKLKNRLNELTQIHDTLPLKVKENVVQEADALRGLLKRSGSKRKKKKYRAIIAGMKAFSRQLEDMLS